MDDAIRDMAQQLELHYPDDGTRCWNTGMPVSSLDMATGERAVVPADRVPANPTGMLVRSGVYDVTRFVWGSRNLWALPVHMNGNLIYYNDPDAEVLSRLLDTTVQGMPVFGANVTQHQFVVPNNQSRR